MDSCCEWSPCQPCSAYCGTGRLLPALSRESPPTMRATRTCARNGPCLEIHLCGPSPLSHFQRMFLPRLRDRRWRLGMHLATAPEHLVYGPEHGEIRIHVATASHLNHEEIVSYMQRLDHPPSWGSIAPTSLNLDNVATFVSKAQEFGIAHCSDACAFLHRTLLHPPCVIACTSAPWSSSSQRWGALP